MNSTTPVRSHLALAGAALLLLLLRPAAAVAEDSILSPKLDSSGTFSETFTAIADLEGGLYLQLQVGVSNIGMSSGKGACRMMVVDEKKEVWTDDKEVKRKEWSFVPGPPAELRVGKCFLRSGEDKTELHVELKKGTIDLTLQAPIRVVRPPGGRVEVDDKFYESDILIPWAAADVTLTLKGESSRTLKGFGYADHSRSTTLPSDLARRWVRFRGLAAEGSLLVLARFPKEGPVDGWVWPQGTDAPTPLASMEVTDPPENDGTWKVDLESKSGARWQIVTDELLYRFAPMEGGFTRRLVRSIVGNPVTYTFRGEATPTAADRSAVRGIVEVTLTDE